MDSYKVWIHIEQIDESKKQNRTVGSPYEAGTFNSEAEAVRFIKNELIIVRPVKLDLQKACRAGFKFLDNLP